MTENVKPPPPHSASATLIFSFLYKERREKNMGQIREESYAKEKKKNRDGSSL